VVKTLVEWVSVRRGSAREQFLEQYTDPVLIHRAHVDAEREASFRTTHARDPLPTPAEPQRVALALGSEIAGAIAAAPDSVLVLSVAKRKGAAFSDQISVGRTHVMDVPVVSKGVSKFHAHFTWSPDHSEYYLTDAGSTNGTFINGQRLEPKTPTEIHDGSIVRFAFWHAHFYLPEHFCDLLEELRWVVPR
jgi:hypothetical protein